MTSETDPGRGPSWATLPAALCLSCGNTARFVGPRDPDAHRMRESTLYCPSCASLEPHIVHDAEIRSPVSDVGEASAARVRAKLAMLTLLDVDVHVVNADPGQSPAAALYVYFAGGRSAVFRWADAGEQQRVALIESVLERLTNPDRVYEWRVCADDSEPHACATFF